MAYMPASSREDLLVPYGVDATAFPVEVAIVPALAGEPSDADYHTAAWEGTDAKLLVGAGTPVVLEPGEYVVWVRITTATQRPVRRSGVLTVGAP